MRLIVTSDLHYNIARSKAPAQSMARKIRRLGETLPDFPKVTHAFCGHSHRDRRCRKQHLHCRSIGATYREKQYAVLDI